MAKVRKRGWKAGEYKGEVWCVGDKDHHCHNCSFFFARESDFYNARLRDASARMNAMLSELREEAPDGRSLVLLSTSLEDERGGHGLLLAYARIGDEPPAGKYVDYDSKEDEIRRALNIQNEVGRQVS
jgi:hypothetical protein